MNFIDALKQNKQKIIDQWFDRIVKTYPQDTTRFLQREQDPFSNPVGNVTQKNIDALFNQILNEKTDPQFLMDHVDPILRIRAIQNFSASDAVGFIIDLKPIVRHVMRSKKFPLELDDYVAFEMRVDQLALYAFDVFMTCKEKIYDLKANEVRNQSFEALERANLLKPEKDNGVSTD
jgi:hypothetical protein